MKLYNTATKKPEQVKGEGQDKKSLGLYACGPTVYDYAHLGHMRKYVMDDVLVRTLRHAGYSVKYVRNITDVGHLASDADTGEDKLEKGAKKYGESVWGIAKRFTDHFHKSMQLMGNIDPDITAVVTDHIPEQLQLVQKLEEKGFTYVIEGDGVYFDTSKFPNYGKMAGLKLDMQKEGARVESVDGKRNPADFALWKFEREGENRAMAWESPWHKRSFPGWHIECSALGIKYLGEQFAIHTGGIDHIPVHHTNEIAQAEAATGKSPFVHIWVHHNFLQVEGQKMSKSLGNFYTVDDILKRGFNPGALRLLFLTSHYRSEQNFTWNNLAGMQKSYEKLMRQVVDLQSESIANSLSPKAKNVKDRFFKLMEEDLKTSEAVALVWEVFKLELTASEKLTLLLEFDEVLGLQLDKAKKVLANIEIKKKEAVGEIPANVQGLLDERAVVRANNDWKRSDEIRDVLKELGYEVKDVDGKQEIGKV